MLKTTNENIVGVYTNMFVKVQVSFPSVLKLLYLRRCILHTRVYSGEYIWRSGGSFDLAAELPYSVDSNIL